VPVVSGTGRLRIGCGVLACKSNVHNQFLKFLCPSKIFSFLCKICTFVLSKVTDQLASTNCPTERRELVERPGKTCAFFAVSGSWGEIKSQVCHDLMDAPSGRVTWIGVVATFLLATGAVIIR
jgi:hypothetical protein